MNLEYKVSGHYFENGKKGFYKGKINLASDGKILGLLEDLDYKDQGKRFVLGFYEKGLITNIKFIKVPQIEEETKFTSIYSLTNENMCSEHFEGVYKGSWIYVEQTFDGIKSRSLSIPRMSNWLKEIFTQEPTEETLAELENIYSSEIKEFYFNRQMQEKLDFILTRSKHKAELKISKI